MTLSETTLAFLETACIQQFGCEKGKRIFDLAENLYQEFLSHADYRSNNPIVACPFYKGNPRKIWTIKRPFTLLPPCRKSCAFSPVPPHSTSPIGWSIGELA